MIFGLDFCKSVLKDIDFMGNSVPEFSGISVDSRAINKNEIFACIKGNHFDAHDFINDAISNGCSGLIINKSRLDVLDKIDSKIKDRLFILIVSDVYNTILELALHWRSQFNIPVVGITGSVGKTSTKEMLFNIMKEARINALASSGNQNTSLGASLNIFKLNSDHKIAIFEMGINRRGEMAITASIVRPTTAIITEIGHSHMQGLGSLPDIAMEKKDIFKYFQEDNIGIINGDQPFIANISYKHPIVKFGLKTTNQIQARKIQTSNNKTDFILKIYQNKYKVVLSTNHVGRVNCAMASAAVCTILGINPEYIIKGIEKQLDLFGRFRQIKIKNSDQFLIDDCYNANPESMKAALVAFDKVDSKGKKIAILGDMLELGVSSGFWHRQLGRFFRKVKSIEHVILVGNLVCSTKKTLPINVTCEHVASWQEARKKFQEIKDPNATILIKGSAGIGLSNLVKEIVDVP